MAGEKWKDPVRVTIREEHTYVVEFDAAECCTEDKTIDMAMWLHTDPAFVREPPTDVRVLSAHVEHVQTGNGQGGNEAPTTA